METVHHFLVVADKTANDYLKVGNVKLQLDKDFNPYHHAVQFGEIYKAPLVPIENFELDPELLPGDKVYFHHHVTKHNQVKQGFFDRDDLFIIQEPKHLFCVIKKGEIVPLQDYLLAKPVKESGEVKTQSGIYLKWESDTTFGSNIESKDLHAEITHLSEQCRRAGLKVGDIIIHRPDADYDIKIEGQEYFRMSKRNVVVVFRDGKPCPIEDNIFLEDMPIENYKAGEIEIVKLKKDRNHKGKLVGIGQDARNANFNLKNLLWEDYENGSTIIYQTGTGHSVKIDGKDHILLKDELVLGFYPTQAGTLN